MNRYTASFLGLVILLMTGGCSEYVEGVRYSPHPAVAEIWPTSGTTQPAAEQQAPDAVAMASIVGIHVADSRQGIPLSVQVRLRLENHGPQPVSFDPRRMELMDGDLLNFSPPMVGDAPFMTLNLGQSAVVEAFFPFPAGHSYQQMNLHALQLSWLVRIDGHDMRQVAQFHRLRPVYDYDPYWDYEPYYYGGFSPYYYGGFGLYYGRGGGWHGRR